MTLKRVFLILMFASLIIGAEGCRRGPSTTKKNTKKIKKGKPIPCPIKDC